MSEKYKYSASSGVYGLQIEIDPDDDLEHIAEQAADDFHDNRDGFESQWPQTITLMRQNEEVIAAFEVQREYQVTFDARKIEVRHD